MIAVWNLTTNISAITVPIQFEASSYSPVYPENYLALDPNNLPRKTTKRLSIRCEVTNFYMAEMPKIPQKLPKGLSQVKDRRFALNGYAYINYPVTNDWMDHKKLLALKRASPKISLEQEALAQLDHNNSRFWPIWVFITLIILPLLFVFISRQKSQKNKC